MMDKCKALFNLPAQNEPDAVDADYVPVYFHPEPDAALLLTVCATKYKGYDGRNPFRHMFKSEFL